MKTSYSCGMDPCSPKQRNAIRPCLTFAPIKTEHMALARYSAVALFLPLALAAGAQSITLVDPGNVPVNGSSFLVHRGSYVDAGLTGEGVLYNFSALNSTSSRTYAWQDPATLPNGGQFPNAEFALTNEGPDTVFYKATANGIERIGDTQTISLGVSYHFTTSFPNSVLELELPLSYGDPFWTDLFDGTFTVDGSSATRTGAITGTADAWGRIVMPGGQDTLDVLRVTTRMTETIVGLALDVDHVHNVNAFYPLWGKFPVLRIVSDSLDAGFLQQNYTYTEWLDTSAVGITDLHADPFKLRIFPNPANSVAEVAFEGITAGALMEVVDMRGATVLHTALGSAGAAPATERIDVSQWDAGLYQLVLTDAKGTRSTRRFAVAR